MAVKLALPEIPPLIQASIRSAGAAVLVWAWSRVRGLKLTSNDRTVWPGLASGVLFGVEFLLIYEGLTFTAASRASVFLYTAPFFVVLGARWLLPGERFDSWQWLGLALSFIGVVVALGVPTPGAGEHELMGDIMLLGAGAGWGVTTLLVKASRLAYAPSEKVLLYQLVVSAPMVGAGAVLSASASGVPSAFSLGWLAQTFWVVSVTYAVWFAMVQRYSASRLSAFTFSDPLFGVASGSFRAGGP